MQKLSAFFLASFLVGKWRIIMYAPTQQRPSWIFPIVFIVVIAVFIGQKYWPTLTATTTQSADLSSPESMEEALEDAQNAAESVSEKTLEVIGSILNQRGTDEIAEAVESLLNAEADFSAKAGQVRLLGQSDDQTLRLQELEVAVASGMNEVGEWLCNLSEETLSAVREKLPENLRDRYDSLLTTH